MNTDVIRKHWIGRVVDARFRLLERLGDSGQSGVFLCEADGNREQQAAIKLFPVAAAGARSCAADWAAAAELYHPHLIRVLHTGRDRFDDTEFIYVVTEYASEILSEILPERALTPVEVREMLGPIFDALTYLHDKGLVHGRLKPSNIMVADDQLKLSVENIRGASAIPKPPQMLDIYDAPEIKLIKVSPASDIWSLGVTLVETLTQSPPDWNRSGTSEPIVPSSVPAPFAPIAQECLRLDPALRCTLNEIRSSLEMGTPIPHRTARNVHKPSRKRRQTIVAACAVVVLAAFAVLMLRSHQTEPSSMPAARPEVSGAKQAQTSAEPRAQTPHETAPGTDALKGAVAHRVLPDVPEAAMRTIHGTVQVSIRLHVDANGTVSDATIASRGPSPYFANLAREAAQSWKFRPAEVNGQSVASVWLLKFVFHQSGIDVTSAEQSP